MLHVQFGGRVTSAFLLAHPQTEEALFPCPFNMTPIHNHIGVFMRTFPRPNSSPFRARVCQTSIKVLFYVPSRKWRIPFFLVLLFLASKLMVEASADFYNFKGDESLSGWHFGISLFFLLKFLEKFDCYNAPWCAGENFSVRRGRRMFSDDERYVAKKKRYTSICSSPRS